MDYDDLIKEKFHRQIQLRSKLFSLRDEKHKEFMIKLIPGVYNILGIKMPQLRKLATSIVKDDWRFYLEIAQDDYFEEIMLQGLVIGYIKEDFEILEDLIIDFIPKIYNWSICDSFCSNLKITEKYKEEMWKLILPYFYSNWTYEIRFSVVMSLNYYIDKKYMNQLFYIYENINKENYYVKMAVAWAISYFFIDFPIETYNYLKKYTLDLATHNMAIQKIIDSKQVSNESKSIIRKIKR